MNLKLLSLAALLALAGRAESVKLDTIEVSASERTALKVSDVTSNVTVITQEAIEESRVATLEEALVRLGGIAMSSNGGPGTATSFYLRGFDAKRTLVLIDGVRYNDVTGLSGAQFPFIHLEDVKQIEIIKGAQSGVWGADASAGVINIVTRSAERGTHLDAALERGSFDTRKASARFSHKGERYDLSVALSRYTTDGFSAAEPAMGSADYGSRGSELGWEEDAYRNTTYALKAGLNLTDRDRLEASFRRSDAYVEYDGGAGVDAENLDDLYGYGLSDYTERSDNRFYTLAYNHRGTLHDLSLQYSFSDFNRRVTDYTGNVKEFSLQDRIGYGDSSFLRIGGSYQHFEHNHSYGAALEESYVAVSAYLTNYNRFDLFAALGKTILTESLRYDRYNDFDDQATGKVGLKQYVTPELYVAVNIGSGYNVPTLYQLYGSFGDPALAPESTLSYDFTLGSERLWVTGFYNRVTDMIEFDLSTYRYATIAGTSTLKGVEIGYRDDFFGWLTLDGGYTYLDAKNADGEFLARRPKHQLDMGATCYLGEAFDISLQGQYVGERYDRKDEQGAQTGEYALLNAVLNYRLNENLTLYGKIDNLTDKYYQTVDGYATARRSLYLGLTARY